MRKFLPLFFLLLLSGAAPAVREYGFAAPIDALSVGTQDARLDAEVSAWDGHRWSGWQRLSLDTDDDPSLTESNLLMLPEGTDAVRVRGATLSYQLHPIRVSHEPARYVVASIDPVGAPFILSRSEWGADESLTLSPKPLGTYTSPNTITRSDQASSRVLNCDQIQRQYPQEFAVRNTVFATPDGKPYVWPIEYSPSVRLIVIHHTADQATGDTRSAVERMRAVYQYHAVSRGWGDIGYNYVIDENGHVYEGREGGDYAVGGHAYCDNVGTMGIALMGNFDVEKPTLAQLHSLQKLLLLLSQKYGIDPSKDVTFHGRSLPPIVGHGDLMSTRCPGYYVRGVLDQIRANVSAGRVDGDVQFPPPPPDALTVGAPSDAKVSSIAIGTKGVYVYQDVNLIGQPGDVLQLDFAFRAANAPLDQRAKIGPIVRSDPRVDVWEATDREAIHLGDDLLLPTALRPDQTLQMHVRVRLPTDPGTYPLTVGSIHYALTADGTPAHVVTTKVGALRVQRLLSQTIAPPSSSSAAAPFLGPTIRIRLRRNEASFANGALTMGIPNGTLVNSVTMAAGALQLSLSGGDCRAVRDGEEIAKGVVRINPGALLTKIDPFPRRENQFRGVLECRVIDGKLALIDELPLDAYLLGLGEEPDSEPYEKQRAFAIAARSYANFYLSSRNRKFPGQPYDGSDSPDAFQKYVGASFETANPQWVRAVTSTADDVLMLNDAVIKPPYFSSDDGRTRSPEEAGWTTFPNATIFAGKPDPWCAGMSMQGHGVGMSGCGAAGQAQEGKKAEDILQYYYPGTKLVALTPKP